MISVDGVDALAPEHGRLFAVVGVFDGLHRGHLYLLEQLRAAAARRDATPAVITFDHHPDEILRGAAPPLLCDPGERLKRLAAEGVGLTVIQRFDDATRRTTYDAFVRRIAERVDLAGFLMTPDAAFGFERAGTPEKVSALGHELGYEVVVVPALLVNGRRVSSSDVRMAIERGDLREAERLLGRPYTVVGRRDATAVSDPEPGGVAADNSGGRAADDAGVRLDFAMPFALPPVGEYRVRVAVVGTPHEVGATLRLNGGAAIQGPVPAADAYAVTFW